MKKCLDNFERKHALQLEKLEEKNVKNLGTLSKDLGIKCDLKCGMIDVFTDRDDGKQP